EGGGAAVVEPDGGLHDPLQPGVGQLAAVRLFEQVPRQVVDQPHALVHGGPGGNGRGQQRHPQERRQQFVLHRFGPPWDFSPLAAGKTPQASARGCALEQYTRWVVRMKSFASARKMLSTYFWGLRSTRGHQLLQICTMTPWPLCELC